MKIVQGDMIFDKAGRLGKVTHHNAQEGRYTVQYEGEAFEKGRKLGIINGIDPEIRGEYENIITQVRAQEGQEERLDTLRTHVKKLEEDPRNNKLLRYLRAEEAFLIHSTRSHPKTYEFKSF
jgi:hypothetical protein